MKPIHLNLAANPFRDYRPVYAVVLLVSVATAVLTIYNAETAWRYLVETRDTRREIQVLDEERARQEARAAAIEAEMKKTDIAAINARARSINVQIADRAFSWTQMLDDLERVFPSDVLISSLNPSATDELTAHLEIACVSRTQDGMVQLINRMIDDPRFERPMPRVESAEGGTWSFSISVEYRPEPGTPAKQAPEAAK